MTRCYQCQGLTAEETRPCPNDPPCPPDGDVCGFPLTDCEHKRATARTEEPMGEPTTANDFVLTAHVRIRLHFDRSVTPVEAAKVAAALLLGDTEWHAGTGYGLADPDAEARNGIVGDVESATDIRVIEAE